MQTKNIELFIWEYILTALPDPAFEAQWSDKYWIYYGILLILFSYPIFYLIVYYINPFPACVIFKFASRQEKCNFPATGFHVSTVFYKMKLTRCAKIKRFDWYDFWFLWPLTEDLPVNASRKYNYVVH